MNTGHDDRRRRAALRLAEHKQEHLLAFWDQLDDTRRHELLDDLERIPYSLLPSLLGIVRSRPGHAAQVEDAEPPEVIRRDSATPGARNKGETLLAEGRVAAFTVAGGQGTRLGFAGPKGAFPISPVRNKTLFQLFAESILSARRRYRSSLPWYVMTSPANHAETVAFFDRHQRFGLPPGDVIFFEQGIMPAFAPDGRILLDEPHRVAMSPDGHGGALLAMARGGVLADMARRGIEHIAYFQVDNPLVHCLDPVFLGLHVEHRSEMSSKTLPKADDLERVGNFVRSRGRLHVIEYSDMPVDLARARRPDGRRRFDAANIAIHVLSRTFVERLVHDPSAFALPWHRAEKVVPYTDPATGRRIQPERPNAVKLEAFVFDALPLAERTLLLETARAEEFSPVKNATGEDSVETARRDMNRRAARWLEAAGASIPRTADGEPDGLFEISPLAAVESGEIPPDRARALRIQPGGSCYIE